MDKLGSCKQFSDRRSPSSRQHGCALDDGVETRNWMVIGEKYKPGQFGGLGKEDWSEFQFTLACKVLARFVQFLW